MSYDDVLKKRIEILCAKQDDIENTRQFYQRIRNLRNEHRELLRQAREKYEELFETILGTEETAIIGYILGIKIHIRKYLHAPCEYRTLKDAALHVQKIELRLRRLRLPIIFEQNEE